MPSHASGQPLPDWVAWDCCEKVHDDGTPCTGAAQGDYGRCLTHLNPDDLEQVIQRAKAEGLDARGVSISPPLLSHILSLLDKNDQDRPIVPDCRLQRATFIGDARFERLAFRGDAEFGGATFTGDARFDRATFTGDAHFTGATLTGDAHFTGATFTGDADFTGAIFRRIAGFTGVAFNENARFGGVTFTRDAEFYWATFHGNAGLSGASFLGNAEFGRASFLGNAGFSGATFSGGAHFDRVNLSGPLRFQSVRPARRLRVALHGSSNGGGGPTVDLKGASFAEPAVVAANPADAVRLVSLAQTDTTNLTLAGLDLSHCLFLGAINLERLRIDGELLLDVAPGWWRARRRVLREEGALRGWSDWTPEPDRPPWETPEPDRPPDDSRAQTASRLQAVYRDLRKGREDAKDEPGAADFYYGEMEMRRKAAVGIERWLLTGYWLVSGYGLRASRAVIALLGLLAAATLSFHFIGGYPEHGWRDTALYAMRTSTSLLRSPAPIQLTRWGQLVEIMLRLLAPVLLGLAVLAVRGRVKR